MKNLIALLFLFMATNIFAARTYVDLFQIGKEPAVNATTLMLGNTGNSASILRHPGPDGSLYFTQSGNGAIVHNTTGTGTTYFDDNGGTVMYFSSRGSLYIYSQNDASEGGELSLIGAGGNPTTHMDNLGGQMRFYGQTQMAFSNTKLTGVATPTASTDAANKAYIDGKYQYNPRMELGDDSLIGGDRTSYIDFHSSNGVDFNSRILRAPGLNNHWDFTNTGTSSKIRFYPGQNNQFEIINAQGDVPFSVYAGNTPSLQTAPITIHESGGSTSGNVFYDCKKRAIQISTTFSLLSFTCPSNEYLSGGGCYTNSFNQYLHENRPNSSIGSYQTKWSCGWQTSPNTYFYEASAICCKR